MMSILKVSHGGARRNNEAFTLMEVIVVASLLLVVFLGAGRAFYSSMRSIKTIQRHIDALEGCYILLSYIENDIRQARPVPGKPFLEYSLRFAPDDRGIVIRRPHERGRLPSASG